MTAWGPGDNQRAWPMHGLPVLENPVRQDHTRPLPPRPPSTFYEHLRRTRPVRLFLSLSQHRLQGLVANLQVHILAPWAGPWSGTLPSMIPISGPVTGTSTHLRQNLDKVLQRKGYPPRCLLNPHGRLYHRGCPLPPYCPLYMLDVRSGDSLYLDNTFQCGAKNPPSEPPPGSARQKALRAVRQGQQGTHGTNQMSTQEFARPRCIMCDGWAHEAAAGCLPPCLGEVAVRCPVCDARIGIRPTRDGRAVHLLHRYSLMRETWDGRSEPTPEHVQHYTRRRGVPPSRCCTDKPCPLRL